MNCWKDFELKLSFGGSSVSSIVDGYYSSSMHTVEKGKQQVLKVHLLILKVKNMQRARTGNQNPNPILKTKTGNN